MIQTFYLLMSQRGLSLQPASALSRIIQMTHIPGLIVQQ